MPKIEFRSLRAARQAAATCTRCPLYARATQTVFGEGPARARVMLVGEQPGDREDLAGEPFVGPAGRLLDDALVEAGLPRDEVYLTNAVKHFKWVPEQRRRLHQKPNAREIAACRPWLDTELALVRPNVVVALGATAGQALMGSEFRVSQSHGKVLATPWAAAFVATFHPSAILRAPTSRRAEMRRLLVADLKIVADTLRRLEVKHAAHS